MIDYKDKSTVLKKIADCIEWIETGKGDTKSGVVLREDPHFQTATKMFINENEDKLDVFQSAMFMMIGFLNTFELELEIIFGVPIIETHCQCDWCKTIVKTDQYLYSQTPAIRDMI